ncbi:MAG TPA: SpoIIE family protein phosphatase [Terriglobales bacterium]|nr:SpoIIE family protein phosphatase [Terriglobales bacterium]
MPALSIPMQAAGPRVLVAEDQVGVIEALRILLKQEGFEIDAVTSPADLLTAVRARPYDLVLMDLNYTRDTTSGAEGLDLIREIHTLDETLPLIAMTAWGSVDLAVEAMRCGAGDFIQKPWDNWRLVGMVRNQMDRRKTLLQAEKERDRELREAGDLQKRLLPKHVTQIPGFDIAADWRPVRQLGGDYFDVLRFEDGSIGLCIADVEGKGVPAALVMSNLQAAVKAFASENVTPRELCTRLNQIFCRSIVTDKFITFFYAHLDPGRKRLTYCNAGHCRPFVLRSDGTSTALCEGGAVLGKFSDWVFEEEDIELVPGDRVVLFTDGVSEAEDSTGTEFGAEGILACLRRTPSHDAMCLQRELTRTVAQHCNNRFNDDATLIIVVVE